MVITKGAVAVVLVPGGVPAFKLISPAVLLKVGPDTTWVNGVPAVVMLFT
jgi:hypothetical protein